MRFRRLIAGVLCALAAVPGISSADNGCRVVPDAAGDVRHPVEQATPLVTGAGGGAVDLTGFGIYPAPWGELLVDIAVVDLDAPWHELADARSYVLEWNYDSHIYRFEALDARGEWSFSASRRSPLEAVGRLEPEQAWPLQGVVDPEARTISLIGSMLMLGEPASGHLVLEKVHAWTEERRSVGTESSISERVSAVMFDRAPSDYDGWATIDLSKACAPEMPQGVGATDLCRVLVDAEYDPSTAGISGGSSGRGIDLTGVFVGSTSEALVVEIGVADPAAQADGMDAIAEHLVRFDLGGRSYEASARRIGEEWTFAVRDYWDEAATVVDGSTSRDRVRIEIPFDAVPGAATGSALSDFDVRSTESVRTTDPAPAVPMVEDHAPNADVRAGSHSLTGECDPYR